MGGWCRIIIPKPDYHSVVDNLKIKAEKSNSNVLCLIPEYGNSVTKKEYNINRMLGYFRRKFLLGEVPTILSNDCTAARLYQYLGMADITPTSTTYLDYENFLKLCQNPEHYFSKPVKNPHYARTFVGSNNGGSIDSAVAFDIEDIEDIEIVYHSGNSKNYELRWEMGRTHYNPNRFMYLLSKRCGVPPRSILESFCQLKGNKMLLGFDYNEINCFKDCPSMKWNIIYDVKGPLENFVDIIGWFNSDQNISLPENFQTQTTQTDLNSFTYSQSSQRFEVV